MNCRRLILVGLLVLIALVPGVTLAKELVQITITGPGLGEPIEVTDEQQLADFDFESVMEADVAEAPNEHEAEYFEVQLAVGDGTDVVATFVYHYFPGINADYGYLYFADFVGGSADSIGQWFQLNDTVDRQLRHVLRDAGVRFGVQTPDCVVPEQTPEA